MSPHPDSRRASGNGTGSPGSPGTPRNGLVDYRLARNAIVREFRKGRLGRPEVCDAHPELLRAAVNLGVGGTDECPICEGGRVRMVSYAFGPKLPASGRCVSSSEELPRLVRSAGQIACYVVEVCTLCGWNHLAKSFLLGTRSSPRAKGSTAGAPAGQSSS